MKKREKIKQDLKREEERIKDKPRSKKKRKNKTKKQGNKKISSSCIFATACSRGAFSTLQNGFATCHTTPCAKQRLTRKDYRMTARCRQLLFSELQKIPYSRFLNYQFFNSYFVAIMCNICSLLILQYISTAFVMHWCANGMTDYGTEALTQ